MLHVITASDKCPQQYASRFLEDRSRGIVVVESDLVIKNGSFAEAHHELDSMEARHRAVGFANANGIGDARINGNVSVYPVNKNGVPLEHVRDGQGQPLPLQHPDMHVWRYRADVPVTRRLV